jgi:hypothetical protein
MDTEISPPARAIRLRRDATIEVGQDGCAAVLVNGSSLRLPGLPTGARAVLDSLAAGDVSDADVQQQVLAVDGMPGLLRWQALVTRLDVTGLIERSVLTTAGPVARLRQVVPGRGPGSFAHAPTWAKLSRFTAIRAQDGKLIAERWAARG